MTDLTDNLKKMRRPRLLVQAAHLAADTGDAHRRAARRPISKLLAEEEMLNHARLGNGMGYSPTRHVQVMSAILTAANAGA